MFLGSAATREWPVVERTAVAEVVRHGLAKRPFAAVMITGPTGIGKSTLARSIADSLPGMTLELVGLHELQEVPLGAFAPVLTQVDWRNADLSMRLSDVVDAIAEVSPSLILVDDAPLLDDISAAVIYQLVRVRKFACLLTARDEHGLSGPLQRLEHEGVLHRAALGPLTAIEIDTVLERRFGENVAPESVRSIHARSEGNPLLLRALALAAEDQDRISSGSLGLRVSEPVLPRHTLDAMRTQLESLSTADRELAQLVALTQPLPSALAPDIDRVDRLVGHGLFTHDSGHVRVAHPLATQVLLDEMTGSQRDSRVDAAAQILGSSSDDQLRFRGVLLQVRYGRALPAADLAWAAGFAHSAQDHSLAARLARLALETDQTFDATLALGSALSALGDPAASDILHDAIAQAATDHESAIAALRLGSHLALRQGEPGTAVAEVESLLQKITDSAAAAIVIPELAKWSSMAGAALPAATPTEDAPPVGGVAELSAMIGQAMIASMSGDTKATASATAAARPLAVSHRAELPIAEDLLDLNDFLVLVFDGRVNEAEHFARERHDRPRSDATGQWSYTLGLLALHTGRAAEALPLADRAVDELTARDFTGLLAAAIAMRATARAQVGGGHWAEPDLTAAQLQDVKVLLQHAETQAWQHASSGNLDAAVAQLVSAAERGVAANHAALAALTAATACRLGRASEVESLLLEIAEATGSPLIATLAAGAAAQASRDPTKLAAAATRLASTGFLASAVEAWQLAAQLTADSEVRRGFLLAAQNCGKGFDLTLRVRPTTTLASLTEREMVIARAAAARQRSHEIAEELGLSVRTIDNNLGRVYRKLGVRNRLELATVVAALSE